MCPTPPDSPLLTDEAVRAVAADRAGPREPDSDDTRDARALAAVLLRYHATEGREVLVETVAVALGHEDGTEAALWRPETEAVVSRLFGAAP